MKQYYIGFTMNNLRHNYEAVNDTMKLLKARKVSARTWLCSMDPDRSAHMFAFIRRSLDTGDNMAVTEVPTAHRPFQITRIAA